MSFASEPGRDDGNLPPVNIVIPDDARELDRDVLAYRREQRALRRRKRLLRLLGPLGRLGPDRPGTIFPLIAACVALSMLAGAMLSVVTISPDTAATGQPRASANPAPVVSLPPGRVRLDGKLVDVRTLAGSLLMLVPPRCDCGPTLQLLADQAAKAHASVYFVYYTVTNAGASDAATMTARYGAGVARTVYDVGSVLFFPFDPRSLTALLVHRDDTVAIVTSFPPGFQLGTALRGLRGPTALPPSPTAPSSATSTGRPRPSRATL